MKHISGLLMAVLAILLLSPIAYANHYVRCQRYYSNSYTYCYRHSSCCGYYTCCRTYRPYYYRYYYYDLNGEVDNACVDACLDLHHSLKQCTRSCYY